MALSSLADDLSPSFSARFRRRSWSCTDGRRLSFGHLDTAERYCRPMPYAEFTCQQRSCRHSRFQDTYVTYHHSFRHCHQSQTFPSSWRLNHRTLVCRTPRSLLPHLHLEPSAINAASWRELEFNHPKAEARVAGVISVTGCATNIGCLCLRQQYNAVQPEQCSEGRLRSSNFQ